MFIKEGNKFKLINGNPDGILPNLESAVYTVNLVREMHGMAMYFDRTDRYKNTNILSVGIFKKINDYIDDFVMPEMFSARKALNGLHKLGLMFTGDPGTGKTYLAGQLAQKMVETNNAIALITNEFWKYNLTSLVDSVRENQPDKMIVVILDEFEKCSNYQLQDADLLSFLDGAGSRDNILILALVNSTSGMKDFLLNRPGRFEQIYNFDEKDDRVLLEMTKVMTPKEYRDRIDFAEITKQLIKVNKRTVDCIKIAIRDAIAEVIYFDNHGAFKSFNSLNTKGKIQKEIGFKVNETEDADFDYPDEEDVERMLDKLEEIEKGA